VEYGLVGMARKHLDAVRRAALRIDTAKQLLGDRMLEAQESGETITDICHAAGLKRTRAYELIGQAKERRQE
jgi:hypothetical protein